MTELVEGDRIADDSGSRYFEREGWYRRMKQRLIESFQRHAHAPSAAMPPHETMARREPVATR